MNTPKEYYEKWMRRCIELAENGRMNAAPNPMVGAVIVCRDRILGEGYHVRCGQPHAEVNAINAVAEADLPLLHESTLYVSLEPCAHYGRTPPCAELIVHTGIPRVVIGCGDPFAKVSGRGIGILREAGVEVIVGVLEEECLELNSKFITCQQKHRPFITLKWACSADGFIDRWRETLDEDEQPALLSTPHTLMRVHRLRAEHQAILLGHNTLRLDRPSLTVRHWSGNQPLRLALGRVAEGELPTGFEAFAEVEDVIASLRSRGVQSLLVEGGAQTLQTFIDAGLWDEAWEELSQTVLGSGVPVPRMPLGVWRESVRHWGVSFTHWRNGEN